MEEGEEEGDEEARRCFRQKRIYLWEDAKEAAEGRRRDVGSDGVPAVGRAAKDRWRDARPAGRGVTRRRRKSRSSKS